MNLSLPILTRALQVRRDPFATGTIYSKKSMGNHFCPWVELYLPSPGTTVPNVLVRECVLEKRPLFDIGLMGASPALSGGSVINLTTSYCLRFLNRNINGLHSNAFFPRRWRAAMIFSGQFTNQQTWGAQTTLPNQPAVESYLAGDLRRQFDRVIPCRTIAAL